MLCLSQKNQKERDKCMTNEQIKITRCPTCGSANLLAEYDDSSEKKLDKGVFWSGLPGALVYAFKARKIQTTFWRCQNCGHTFPMEN